MLCICLGSYTLVTAILAWFHIASAMMWLGGGILFAFVIGPGLAKLSPPSTGEFFVKVVPRVSMFFRVVAGATVLFGVLLILTGLSNGDFGPYSFSSKWGFAITVGLFIGLVAFLNSEFVAQPPLRKVIRILREMQSSGQHQPPAELPKTVKRAQMTASVTVILLIIALVFMVSAGFY